jgi:hypothetical protein
MRVLLKLTLDCVPEAAWRALRSPAVLREVVAPWLDFRSLEPGGLPTQWEPGVHRVQPLALRRWPAGEERVDLSFLDGPADGLPDGVRMLRDAGGATAGPFAMFRSWDHRMAISAAPGGRTLYRDQLLVSSGSAVADALAWYSVWSFWQWRGARLRRLAPSWSDASHEAPSPPARVRTTSPA